MATKATIIGFGTSTPKGVLTFLSKASKSGLVQTIEPRRSSSLELDLLNPPHRTFVKTNIPPNNDENLVSELFILCMPSVSDYSLNSLNDVNEVRSKILQSSTNNERSVLVLVYNPDTNQFELNQGSVTEEESIDSILNAMQSKDMKAISSFNAATLTALAQLDMKLSKQLNLTGEEGQHDTVIVVGSGGREHAIAVALARSPLVEKVIVCPGNGGTAKETNSKITNAPSGYTQQNDSVIRLTKETNAKMVVVGPEAPLVDGLVDALAIECPDVLAFGPTKAAAELEASKAFTKDFLMEHGIPTAKYQNFTKVEDALAYVESLSDTERVVVKASGLAAGKGVLLPTTKTETLDAVKQIMSDRSFGDAGDTCVIESFLSGPEASCLAFCDGKTAVLMPAAQDHKRALDGDQGLNTGGMGAYSPAPCVTPALQKEIEAMCIKTVEKMAERGTPYVGVLYAGMMLTPNDGPYVLEFNCRFGDPETQVLLPLLESDLYEIMTACCKGTLEAKDVRFKENTAAATVVCAAKGYPETYPKGMEITGLDIADKMKSSVKVYHAGTKLDESGKTLCSGGRVIAVTGMGPNLSEALKHAYGAVHQLDFVGSGESLMHYRTDIANRAIHKPLKIGVLGSTRGTSLIPVMEACASGQINAEITAVLSNRSKAEILDKGRSIGATCTTTFLSCKDKTREEYDAECTSVLLGAGVELVLLIGYMRIVSKDFTDFWSGKCYNVHPSLLPKHGGLMDLEVHQSVLDAGDSISGCTIHEVTDEVDGGPIVVQKTVKVESGETAESLKAKVQPLEGQGFIEAVQNFISKKRGVISYADAGVSIDSGNTLVERIKPSCKRTIRPGCDAELGGFGGLFDLAAAGYTDGNNTILIGATDGVGTKLRVAQLTNHHDGVGIDLVAMCVNDLIVAGGEPLFFLDYYATGKLEVDDAATVIKGIAEGCAQAGCGLIGGETAEMPSMYSPGDYDLAGFAVGAVQRDAILPQNVSAGDVLLGLPSSGIHSNGFSLVRRLVTKEGLDYDSPCPWDSTKSLGQSLLTPTKIYVKACLPLLKEGLLNALSHITGGGLLENLPRSLPKNLVAEISGHPPLPPVFAWMKQTSGLDDREMLRTFNCGIGMVLVVKPGKVERVVSLLRDAGEDSVSNLGTLVEGEGEQVRMTCSISST